MADRQIVDAGEAAAHQACLIKLPVFVAIGAEPLAGHIMPFIGETHRHAVFAKALDFLDQPIVVLPLPLSGKEGDDFGATADELYPVPPLAVLRVGQ
jgi:hypothetical protein